MKQKLSLYWSRRDFRLSDNPALTASIKHVADTGALFFPVFILEDYMVKADALHQFGYPSRVFLSHALPQFAQRFKNFTVLSGKAAQSIILLSREFDIDVFVNEDVYTDFYTQIRKIRDAGVSIKLFNDALTVSKDTVTGTGNMYSVFTPFKKAVWHEFCTAKVLPKINTQECEYYSGNLGILESKKVDVSYESIWNIFSKHRRIIVGDEMFDIDSLLQSAPTYNQHAFNETSAVAQFDLYLRDGISKYKETRDQLKDDGTSRMSTALAWGLVSSRMLRQKIQRHFDNDFLNLLDISTLEGPVHYISELIWREFYRYLFYHKPELMNTEFQEKFRGTIQWVGKEEAKKRFTLWIQGKTGYTVVDAAMMELAQTGYMHNRARMIVASVLTKNLGVDWRWGQEYFRAMLIDLDEASNNGGWQWGASVGADPKPIRIFNPYLQAENYDKSMSYQRKHLSEEYFLDVPKVIIEHKEARNSALKRYGLIEKIHGTPRDY